MSVIQFFPVIESVQDLQQDTLEYIKFCEGIRSVKLLCSIYDILNLTDEINLKYNNPPSEKLVCDVGALTDMCRITQTLYIENDPKRDILMPYLSKTKKLVHYYNTWDKNCFSR